MLSRRESWDGQGKTGWMSSEKEAEELATDRAEWRPCH